VGVCADDDGPAAGRYGNDRSLAQALEGQLHGERSTTSLAGKTSRLDQFLFNHQRSGYVESFLHLPSSFGDE
jgi:hypothetical protein